MESTYLYSGTYTSVLSKRLLTAAQRELLLGTTSVAEVERILQDTKIAPFLTAGRPLKEALAQFTLAQRQLLERLAPNDTLLSILFLRYDYENLKQVALGLERGETDEQIVTRLHRLGTIPPATLIDLVRRDQLIFSHEALATTYRRALDRRPQELFTGVFDHGYLTHIRKIADTVPGSFVDRYVTMLIDAYNIGMRLRVLTHPESNSLIVTGAPVPGGSLSVPDLENLEHTLAVAERFSRERGWKEVVAAFAATKDFSDLERMLENHRMRFLKEESIATHTIAPLFGYFHAVLEETQFISAIIAAHEAGLNGSRLRTLVRTSFTHYAY